MLSIVLTEPSAQKGTTDTSSAEFAKTTGTAAQSADTPDNPSTEMKKRDVPADTTKGQNDVRDPEDPQTNPKSAPTDVNNTEEGVNESQKLEGAGPKPLDAVAKEHGGDAGQREAKPLPGGDDKKAEEEDEDGPNAKSKGEGTGEMYVKTSGLQADGGDFDATKPGAGREADRLMEQKGMHPNEAAKDSHQPSDGGEKEHSPDTKEKKSLKDKIKDKLHKN
ncbi:hypothetical protein F5Y15DRAFT_379108 [Xylariaceae sp. FL0016]|nr:hypothetical protein F5Y15DRAFT_379108 [Xylariaceae sp. FL0016]